MYYVVKKRTLFGFDYSIEKKLKDSHVELYRNEEKSACEKFLRAYKGGKDRSSLEKEIRNYELERELNELELCECGFYMKSSCICKTKK